MQKNTYSAKHSSTKLTKALLCIIWILIIAVLVSIGVVFAKKAMQIDGKADAEKSSGAEINSTVLTVVYDDTYSKTVPGFILLNFNSNSGAISVASIPADVKSKVNEKSGTLFEQYKYGGIIQVKNALESLCDNKIDHYLQIECELLSSVADIMGTVEYNVPDKMYQKSDGGAILCDIKKGKQSLGAQQFTEFFRYGGWNYSEKADNLAKLTWAMINTYSTEEKAQKIPTLFSETATELYTDISVIGANELSSSYNDFMVLKSTAAEISIVEDNGVLNEKSLKNIKNIF